MPLVRKLIAKPLGENQIAEGDELTCIALGLGMMVQDPDLANRSVVIDKEPA